MPNFYVLQSFFYSSFITRIYYFYTRSMQLRKYLYNLTLFINKSFIQFEVSVWFNEPFLGVQSLKKLD